VLYEPAHSQLLASVIERHAAPNAEILVTDPGRGHSARFSRLLEAQGFELTETRCPMDDQDAPPYRGNLLYYSRNGARVVV
jgi:hypothetical protein